MEFLIGEKDIRVGFVCAGLHQAGMDRQQVFDVGRGRALGSAVGGTTFEFEAETALCGISPDAYRKAMMELDDKTLKGSEVLAAFRQTHKLADWSDPNAAGQHYSTFIARFEMTEPTGAETIVLLRLADSEILGRVSSDARVMPGTTARFAMDTRKICLFDPKTERLIA